MLFMMTYHNYKTSHQHKTTKAKKTNATIQNHISQIHNTLFINILYLCRMISNQYKTARAFSSEYGAFLGIAWFVDFLLIVEGMAKNNNGLATLGAIVFIALPVLTIYFAFRFKQHLPYQEKVSLTCAAFFSLFLFINAEFISFVLEYIYLAIFDNGEFFKGYQDLLSSKEVVDTYNNAGLGEMLKTTTMQMDQLAGMTAFDKTLTLFGLNITISFYLFFPTWITASLRSKRVQKEESSVSSELTEQNR